MEAAILTALLLLSSSPALRSAWSRRAASQRRGPRRRQTRTVLRRRSDFPRGRSRSRAGASGCGSRHLEPPLSPPFLSRSPPPPEMAEPRPGSHTTHTPPPCCESPALAGFRGGWREATSAVPDFSPAGAQTTIVGAAILGPCRFPAQHSAAPETSSTRGREWARRSLVERASALEGAGRRWSQRRTASELSNRSLSPPLPLREPPS